MDGVSGTGLLARAIATYRLIQALRGLLAVLWEFIYAVRSGEIVIPVYEPEAMPEESDDRGAEGQAVEPLRPAMQRRMRARTAPANGNLASVQPSVTHGCSGLPRRQVAARNDGVGWRLRSAGPPNRENFRKIVGGAAPSHAHFVTIP